MTHDDLWMDSHTVDSQRARLVRDAAAAWQRHLVDLGGRNSLLWQRTDDTVELDLTTAHPAGVAKLLSGRNVLLSEIVREPHAHKAAYERALAVRDLSRELLEERGIISCFLALGNASWEMSGDAVPAAPILLRQCDIHFGGRNGDDLVLEVSRTVELNSALATYMASRGVNIDQDYVASLASGPHGFDPAPTFEMMRRAGASIPGFEVKDRIVLSTFSYAKLSMVRDVAEQSSALAQHPVIAAMAGDPGAREEVAQELPQSGLDADPRDEFLVLDADSTQQAAIDAVMAGQHLVLMGPPGTGKSQTIANLVATLTAHGKSALFVAEKRAAIDAVIGRLENLGLADLMLDAHTGSGTPADFVDGLARRLVTAPAMGAPHVGAALHSKSGQVAIGVPSDPEEVVDTLERERFTLLEHVRALHRIRDPFGVSASDAQSRIAELNALPNPPRSRVRLEGEPLQRLDVENREEVSAALVDLAERKAWRGDGKADPWFGSRVRGADHLAHTRDLVRNLSDGELAEHRQDVEELFEQANLPAPTSMAQASEVLDLMEQVRGTLETFSPEVFCESLPGFVDATATRAQRKDEHGGVGVMERRRLLKEARAALRPGRPPADLHTALERAHAQQRRWKELGGAGRPCSPKEASQIRREHAELTEELDTLGMRLEGSAGSTDLLNLDLPSLEVRIDELAANTDRLAVVAEVGAEIARLRAQGLGNVIDDFAARGLGADEVAIEWEFIWWTSVLARVRRSDDAYEAHRGDDLRATAARFADADREHLWQTPGRVRRAAYRRVDAVAEHYPQQVEAMEAAVVFGHHAGSADALRQAFAGAPDLMTSLAPCWAMSPLVVAQILPPGRWFDVVIFDEASQIPPAEAISAISRGTQIVVAGDTQQLAPTSFFQRTAAGEDTAHTGESVLDVLSRHLPVRYLRWHYRSLDERLIAFSNDTVYDGELVTFPRARRENVLRLHVVPWTQLQYPQLGGEPPQVSEPEDGEVKAVIKLIREHVQQRPDESLGVITLGLTHARRIERALIKEAAKDPAIAELIRSRGEGAFFVKNLERVQGDERDAVILSLGIVPRDTSSLVRRFGALNHVGGERRLNVAITRARRRMDVVTSFAGEDLDPQALRSRGATMLRDFLRYVAECDERFEASETEDGIATVGGKKRRVASTGSVALKPLGVDTEPFDVPFVVHDLARRLEDHGLRVHTGYGHSRFRIDIAVEHPREPGRMLLAIESDGPHYASMSSVRERDRLRIEALGRVGWYHDRVWTVDLFRDPARDAARIVDLIDEILRGEDAEGW